MDIMSIASKYIVLSVIAVAVGSVSIVYSILIYLVYGLEFLVVVVFGAFFTGAAFLIIGTFLSFWGLFWLRNEGSRLRKSIEGEKESKKKTTKKHSKVTWDTIAEHSYGRIAWYASRFLIFSSIGIVIGFIALVYGVLNMFFFAAPLQDLNVILGVFIGIGSIVASVVILVWGLFWRRQAEKKRIF